jgi:hypothetical protein
MKKKKITSEGVTKASIHTKVRALQKDMIDFLTRHTVQDTLKMEFTPVRDWNP